jgi:hypothetical protein
MRSTFEDRNKKIRDVLNDDQKKKFDEMQQHGRGHRPSGGSNPQ